MQDQGAKVAISREKTWDEMSDSERISLLRRELRHARTLLAEINKEFRKLSHHTHAADGSIAIPYRTSTGEDSPAGYRYDPLA